MLLHRKSIVLLVYRLGLRRRMGQWVYLPASMLREVVDLDLGLVVLAAGDHGSVHHRLSHHWNASLQVVIT
jgi:hypothetical protein